MSRSFSKFVGGIVAPCSVAVAALWANPSWAADGLMLPLDPVKSGSIKIDGVIKDWTTAMTPLEKKVSGSPGSGNDLAVRGGVGVDADYVYVAMDIIDKKLMRTKSYGNSEDRATLVLAFPDDSGNYTAVEVDLFAGDPGNVAGAVRIKGSDVKGAQLVEAPQQGGLTFEAKIPWSAFPQASKVRCGLRGALKYHDSDGGAIKGIIATAPDSAAGSLPYAPIQSEYSLFNNFVKDKGLTGGPRIDKIVDMSGDAYKERIVVWDQYVFVLGSHFRGGTEYYFADVGAAANMVPTFEVRDMTGDGRAEVVIRKRIGSGSTWREIMEVQTIVNDQMSPIFQHEVGISASAGAVVNSHKFHSGGKNGSTQIEIGLGTVEGGATQANWKDQPETAFDGTLLPWATVKSQMYEYDGTKFTKIKEEKQAAGGSGTPGSATGSSAKSNEPPPPPPPRPPTADELLDGVLDLFKKDRKVPAGAKPRFDIATNVAGDNQNERILAFGKELVVFGKGFLGGKGYVSMGVAVADGKDIVDVTTRDLTGDGKAEILVRAIQRMSPPKEKAKEFGNHPIERELLFVYSVQNDKLVRVLAAETGITMGDKHVFGTIGFVRGKQGLDLELGPGFAAGTDKESWPFRQETDSSNNGGLEPMVLPWTTSKVRLSWNGSAFAR